MSSILPYFYTPDELPKLLSLGYSTIERMVREEKFPKPRVLTGRRVGYLREDVEEWVRTRPISDLSPPSNTGAKKS